MLINGQLISEGSSKLASVPSGGAGGAAPAAGGAAAAAPAEEVADEKDDGMLTLWKPVWEAIANAVYREGRVRRGYGFRSFRLSNQLTRLWVHCSRHFDMMDTGHLEGVVRALRIRT